MRDLFVLKLILIFAAFSYTIYSIATETFNIFIFLLFLLPVAVFSKLDWNITILKNKIDELETEIKTKKEKHKDKE